MVVKLWAGQKTTTTTTYIANNQSLFSPLMWSHKQPSEFLDCRSQNDKWEVIKRGVDKEPSTVEYMFTFSPIAVR